MSDPVSLGGAANRYLRLSGNQAALSASSVLTAWHQVVGPEVSRHTEGGRFRNGNLLVFVDSSAWANELRVMGEAFRASLNAKLGKETVTSLRFDVSRRVSVKREMRRAESEGRARYAPRKTARRGITAKEHTELRIVSESVGDPEVAHALRRAMEADLLSREAEPTEGGPDAG